MNLQAQQGKDQDVAKIQKSNKITIMVMFFLPILIVLGIVGSQSYTNTNELQEKKDECIASGGTPEVQSMAFNLHYDFSCK